MSSDHDKTRPHQTTSPPEPRKPDAISLALRLLAKELRQRLRRHPGSHLLADNGETVEVSLRLPTGDMPGWLESAKLDTAASLDNGLRHLLAHRAVFQPGRIYCLRCTSVDCGHSAPQRCGEVFAGYGPSGVPRFLDLGQWLLERQEPRIDLLYRQPPGLVAHATAGADLTAALLPAYRDGSGGYFLHGQVAAGWYRFPAPGGHSDSVALTLQVVSTQPARGQRRLGLNLVGVGPEGQPLENLFDRAGELPWIETARWAQRVLRDIERTMRPGSEPHDPRLENRLEGLLAAIARRLERQRRAHDRRTRHGQKRHREGSRPTWKALADLEGAKDEDILFDTRRRTLVVVGDNGRAHVFNQAGRLVTSIRYSLEAIARRRERRIWRPAGRDEISALRSLVAADSREDSSSADEAT